MAKRPYKSAKLRLLEGNRSGTQVPEEPKPHLGKLKRAPVWMDKEAQKFYRTYGPVLWKCGLLSELDHAAFEVLCVIASRLSYIQGKIDSGEPLTNGVQPSVWIKMEKSYLSLFRQFCNEFGCTPKGRIGLAVSYVGDDDEDDLLS